MANNIFRTKSIYELTEEANRKEHRLKKTLSAFNLTTLGVGAIIGAGIFVLSGQAAAQYAGPAIILSFIVSAVACVLAGFCYAEFASMIPISGSAYTYSYATLGEFLAWIMGWDLILEYLFAAAAVSVGWSGYLVSFLRDFHVNIPVEYTTALGTKLISLPEEGWKILTVDLENVLTGKGIDISLLPQTTAICNVPAMLIVALLTLLLVIGIRETSIFNNIMVVVKISIILIFIVAGFFFISKANWHPFIPENTGTFGKFGLSGILRAASIIFFAYIGFDAVSTTAQEAKNPQRDMPKGILGSLGIATAVYILFALVLTGIVSYTDLNVPDPVAVGVNQMGEKMFWLRYIIKIAAIAGLSSVILVMLLSQPRIFLAMASDGLLPRFFAKVHTRFRTPYVSTILTGIIAIMLAGIFPLSRLGELVNIGTLFAFTIICISVIVLRKTRPDIHRPFKAPWVPFIPLMGALICFAQMVVLAGETWLWFILWLALGVLVYFSYGMWHSKKRMSEK
jgi:APA family basic amino acid/polyamine antiporter